MIHRSKSSMSQLLIEPIHISSTHVFSYYVAIAFVIFSTLFISGCSFSTTMSDADLISKYYNADSGADMEKYVTYKHSYQPLFQGTFMEQRLENEQLTPHKVSNIKTADKLAKGDFKIISVSLRSEENGNNKSSSSLAGVVGKEGKKHLQPDSLISTELHSSGAVQSKIDITCTGFNIGRTADGHTVIVVQLKNNTPNDYSFNWVDPPIIYLTDVQGNKVKSSAISSVADLDIVRDNPRDHFQKEGGSWIFIIPFANFTGEINSLTIEPLIKLNAQGLPANPGMHRKGESITIAP